MAVCRVPQPRLVCAEYFASQVVTEATLVDRRIVSDKDDPAGISAYVYTLHAGSVLRGKVGTKFRVYEENSSGRATFDWKMGRKYLLFLFYSPQYKSWILDGCGNSGPLSQTQSVLAQSDRIKAEHGGGVIQGVVSEQALSIPIPGVRVEAIGTSGRYTTKTNSKGEFQMEVPVGHYVVDATNTGLLFERADLSYGDPHSIRIESGGCAQIQFAKRR